MKHDLRVILALIFLFLISQFAGLAILYEDMEVLNSDPDGIIFSYLVPELTQSKIKFGGEVFDLISIDKCALSNLPGKPQLPARRVVIAVPLEAEISVEIFSSWVGLMRDALSSDRTSLSENIRPRRRRTPLSGLVSRCPS